MKKRRLISLGGMLLWGLAVYSQHSENLIKSRLEDYFLNYPTTYTTATDRCKITSVAVDEKAQTIGIYLNELFAGQSFDTEKVGLIYDQVRRLLPSPYDTYTLVLYGKDTPIEQLATDIRINSYKRWGKALYRGAPWVERTQRPFPITRGLQRRHLSVWASHGRYYKEEEKAWTWQRPSLYCTTEDLFTQTIVIPFLIPMLENAGAIVFSPRERDWQPHETIVDNDTPETGGTYSEKENKYAWENAGTGFARLKTVYKDTENPFKDGTARYAHAVNKKSQMSEIRWTPDIPEAGRYAVYVSYMTLPNSVSDARYVIRHKGISTSFHVNQKMGGGTWVYLGTFDFGTNAPHSNYVSLSNMSDERGIVTADAVRFGGGMGNIARGDLMQETVSGMPRCLEGARYNAQWSGMPYEVYSPKQGTNDYSDDINVRSLMTNYLAGGSSYLPGDSGLHVPIEMSIALHSDAGIAKDGGSFGTLGIYTTDFNDGQLPAGITRLTSRDLCDIVMSEVHHDLDRLYGPWKRRQMLDRNYSETREPQVPSMILEMLSHQNFHDMILGHDPVFKFHLARAVYKGILKYTSYQHETDYVVQPLPVTCFQTRLDHENKRITLSWTPRQDEIEPTASPKGYIVYTKRDNQDFDNGTFVSRPNYTLQAEENVIYSFKVTAVNEGGESFPSEELSAMLARNALANVLIIDGFQRIAGPQVVMTDSTRGFDMLADPGVPYLCSPGFSGPQHIFNTLTASRNSWGVSGNEWDGKMMAGNTFNHSRLHGESIATTGTCSFASASRSAVESQAVNLHDYNVIDLILGLQKNDGYSSRPYPSLTPALCNALKEYTRMHGNLLVSGAYVARDQRQKENVEFLRNTLKIDAYAPVSLNSYSQVAGMNTILHLITDPHSKHYAVHHSDCLIPLPEAFTTLLYTPSNYSAAVAYQGTDYHAVTLGFPFECIKYAADRDKIMNAFLQFLLAR